MFIEKLIGCLIILHQDIYHLSPKLLSLRILDQDGAAFGAEIADIVEQQTLRPRKLAIFLPESFEWLIIKSGVIKKIDTNKIDHPEQYADSTLYMSWEQYFTDLLIETTKESDYMKYTKSHLSDYYLLEKNIAEITKIANGIKLQ